MKDDDFRNALMSLRDNDKKVRAFAAGAILFVVYKELIPESHGDGNERSATFSFVF